MTDPIRIGGFFAPFDTEAVIAQLTRVREIPLLRLDTNKAIAEARAATLADIESRFISLRTRLQGLTGVLSVSGKSTKVDGSGVTASASASAATGSFSVNVLQVAAGTRATGNAISAGGVTLGGLVTGDTSAPSVASSFVNRPIDGNGTTYDVLFDEDVDMTFAGDALNWSSSGAQSVLDVTVLDDDAVRVVLSAPLGGGEQLQLAGGLSDPAGNTAGALAFTPEG